MNVVIAYSRAWYKQMVAGLVKKYPYVNFYTIESSEELSQENLAELDPSYIFFPHWSHYIDRSIYENYEAVIFHMTDLPFGRGGSPLQNLIARGIYETKISALKCVEELDAGPIYLKKNLSLYGDAEEIYIRASTIIASMIGEIIENCPQPVEQEGEIVNFTRRKPEEGDITHLEDLNQVYDYIRMLDAEGYPAAFIETEHFRLEFDRASLKENEVLANVRITYRNEER